MGNRLVTPNAEVEVSTAWNGGAWEGGGSPRGGGQASQAACIALWSSLRRTPASMGTLSGPVCLHTEHKNEGTVLGEQLTDIIQDDLGGQIITRRLLARYQ